METPGSDNASRRVALTVNAISSFIGAFMMTAVSIALPAIGREFAMEAVMLGWVVTAMFLSNVVLLLAAGRLADIYGRKRIFISGVITLMTASFLCSFASSGIMLIIWRGFQGIGSAMAHSSSLAIVTSVFPAESRGRAIGISLAFTYLGASVGPFLGGILIQHLGWRSVFLLVGCLSLLVIGLTFWKLKGEWAEARGEKFDITGSIIFGISLVALMYGFTIVLTPPGIALLIGGALGVVVFFRWEARVDNPILNVSVFRKNTVFVFSNLATLISYSSTVAVITLLTLYLQYNKGFSPQTAGLILLAHSVSLTIVAPIAGRLSDKIQPQVIATAGIALNFCLFIFFFFLTDDTSLGLIIAGLALFGLGWGLFSSPNSNAVMGSVEKSYLGVASATMGTMRSSGMMLSMGITMILFSVYIGDAEITPEYYPAFLSSMKMGFLIFAALSFAGVFAQLAGRKTA